MTFNLPQPDDERTLQEWCSSELVSLPSTAPPASDGTVLPLNQREREELSDHLRSGHSSKSNLCRGCLQAEGPRKVHRTVRDIDGFTYFLVGALRLPGFPLLIDVEVRDALERMVAFFESLQGEGLPSLTPQESNVFTAIVLVNLPLHTSSDFSPIARAFTTPLPLGTTLRLMELLNVQLA